MSEPRWSTAFTIRWLTRFALGLTAVVLFAFFMWLGAQRMSIWWLIAALPLVYLVASILYRYDDRLPGWLYQALDVTAEHVPTISWLKRRRDVARENEGLLKEFETTLGTYGFSGLDAKFRQATLDQGRVLTVRWVAKKTHGEISPSVAPVVLELLHDERVGLPTLTQWPDVKNKHLGELAEALCDSDRFSRFTPDDLAGLARELREFDLTRLATELEILSDLDARITRVASIYADGGVAVVMESAPTENLMSRIATLAAERDDPTRHIDDPRFQVDLLARIDNSGDDPAVRLVRLGVVLAEREPASTALLDVRRWQVVRGETEGNGGSEAIEVLHAYLWAKYTRSTHGATVALSEFDTSWAGWKGDAERHLTASGDGYSTEIARLTSKLQEGRWPTFRDADGEFHVVDTPAHEEIREHDAYLINFDERSGPVALLIDVLTDDDRQADLAGLGVSVRTKDGKPTYRFGRYTRNTRLGITPRGMPFHEFQETLNMDLRIVLENRKALFPDIWRPASPAGTQQVRYGKAQAVILDPGSEEEEEMRGTSFSVSSLTTAHGRLAGQPQSIGPDRAMVIYVADPAPPVVPTDLVVDTIPFDFTDSSGASQHAKVDVAFQPRGSPDLQEVEITLDRVDLAHCRELRFGGPDLRPLMRHPSICDVWSSIANRLEPDELMALKSVFDRAAGGVGCP